MLTCSSSMSSQNGQGLSMMHAFYASHPSSMTLKQTGPHLMASSLGTVATWFGHGWWPQSYSQSQENRPATTSPTVLHEQLWRGVLVLRSRGFTVSGVAFVSNHPKPARWSGCASCYTTMPDASTSHHQWMHLIPAAQKTRATMTMTVRTSQVYQSEQGQQLERQLVTGWSMTAFETYRQVLGPIYSVYIFNNNKHCLA